MAMPNSKGRSEDTSAESLDRQRRALDVLARLLDAPPDSRAAALDDLCAGDAALRAEVESLLQEDARPPLASGDDFSVGSLARAAAAGAFGARFPPRIGPYRVLRLIGEGGMAVVLEAEEDSTGRRVALKVLSHLAASPRARRRFEREATVMSRLRHPGIARVLDAGSFESDLGTQPYLVLELVEGERLNEHARVHALTLRARVELVAQVADAVEHAHEHGVVHRDLKPGNVLVTRDGRVKVLDFGVAQAEAASDERTDVLTGTGVMVGTLAYMSPEQIAGHDVDAQTDVHALGVMLYELLTLRLPHEIDGLPLMEAARRLRDEDPPRPSSFAPEVRGDLEAIVMTAIAKDRGRRYASAAALATDLRRWLAGEPVVARPETAMEGIGRLVRRHRALATGIAAVFVALVLGLVASAWQAARATRVAREERRVAYVADVHAVRASLTSLEPASARRHLEAAPVSHRGWEWHHLASRLQSAQLVVRAGGSLRSVAVSPDGKSMASSTRDGYDEDEVAIARAWTSTGEPLGTPLRSWIVPSVAFDEQGHALGLAVPNDAAFNLHDLVSDRSRARLELTSFNWKYGATDQAVMSRDGSVVLFSASTLSGVPVTSVIAWTPSDGRVTKLRDFIHPSYTDDGPTSLALSPSRRFAAIGTQFGHVHVLDLHAADADRSLLDVRLGRQPITVVAFDPSDARLIVGGQDNSAVVLDARTGEVLESLEGHRAPVLGAAWSSDGAGAFTACDDQVVRAFDARTGRLAGALLGHEAGATCVSEMPGGLVVSGGLDGTLRTFSMRDSAPALVLSGHDSFVYPLAWSVDGSRLYTGSWDHHVIAWDPATGQPTGPRFDHGESVVALAISPDGRTLAVAGTNSGAVLVDAGSMQVLRRLGPIPQRAPNLAFSPDGRLVAVVSWDDRVRLFDVATGAVTAELAVDEVIYRQAAPIAFSPDGRLLLVPWTKSVVGVVEVPSLRLHATLVGHQDGVNAGCFSSDGSMIATAADDRTARTWDARTGGPVAVMKGHLGFVYGVAFSPDGSRLASGSKDGTVRLWDPRRGDDLLLLEGHRDYVYSVAFSPDGTRLASGSGDTTVRLWSSVR
jgi:WD40 repeat protein